MSQCLCSGSCARGDEPERHRLQKIKRKAEQKKAQAEKKKAQAEKKRAEAEQVVIC